MNPDPFSLDGKRILVTGASSGLGKAIAIACSQRGAKIVATGRDEIRLQETIAALDGTGHIGVHADLISVADRERLALAVGTVDGVVHSAGISRLSPIRMATERHVQEIWQINYEAPVLLTQRLLAKGQIANDGSIVFLASIAAYIGVPAVGVYSGTKAALIATMRCLAMEVAKRRIRVNALAPALVDTPLLGGTGSAEGWVDAQRPAYPLGIGDPRDVANAAIFFLSPASRWITGTTLIMDGGLTIT